ncbi:hypothetical protein OESDEN_17395 [Oesophagostomum dentatum]|uniref:Uncharacterized protein n=1 Tax=Oesophagostomum dentatum TaxID=61180 RepID=A0A0B1SI65_OESDE|nr:hypothetical protein OESDEN_17395 [Oesophagostomum dentatum]
MLVNSLTPALLHPWVKLFSVTANKWLPTFSGSHLLNSSKLDHLLITMRYG